MEKPKTKSNILTLIFCCVTSVHVLWAAEKLEVTREGLAGENRILNLQIRTTSQYCDFLNERGKVDLHGFYDEKMNDIVRVGEPGHYSYLVSHGAEEKPMVYVDSFSAKYCENEESQNFDWDQLGNEDLQGTHARDLCLKSNRFGFDGGDQKKSLIKKSGEPGNDSWQQKLEEVVIIAGAIAGAETGREVSLDETPSIQLAEFERAARNHPEAGSLIIGEEDGRFVIQSQETTSSNQSQNREEGRKTIQAFKTALIQRYSGLTAALLFQELQIDSQPSLSSETMNEDKEMPNNEQKRVLLNNYIQRVFPRADNERVQDFTRYWERFHNAFEKDNKDGNNRRNEFLAASLMDIAIDAHRALEYEREFKILPGEGNCCRLWSRLAQASSKLVSKKASYLNKNLAKEDEAYDQFARRVQQVENKIGCAIAAIKTRNADLLTKEAYQRENPQDQKIINLWSDIVERQERVVHIFFLCFKNYGKHSRLSGIGAYFRSGHDYDFYEIQALEKSISATKRYIEFLAEAEDHAATKEMQACWNNICDQQKRVADQWNRVSENLGKNIHNIQGFLGWHYVDHHQAVAGQRAVESFSKKLEALKKEQDSSTNEEKKTWAMLAQKYQRDADLWVESSNLSADLESADYEANIEGSQAWHQLIQKVRSIRKKWSDAQERTLARANAENGDPDFLKEILKDSAQEMAEEKKRWGERILLTQGKMLVNKIIDYKWAHPIKTCCKEPYWLQDVQGIFQECINVLEEYQKDISEPFKDDWGRALRRVQNDLLLFPCEVAGFLFSQAHEAAEASILTMKDPAEYGGPVSALEGAVQAFQEDQKAWETACSAWNEYQCNATEKEHEIPEKFKDRWVDPPSQLAEEKLKELKEQQRNWDLLIDSCEKKKVLFIALEEMEKVLAGVREASDFLRNDIDKVERSSEENTLLTLNRAIEAAKEAIPALEKVDTTVTNYREEEGDGFKKEDLKKAIAEHKECLSYQVIAFEVLGVEIPLIVAQAENQSALVIWQRAKDAPHEEATIDLWDKAIEAAGTAEETLHRVLQSTKENLSSQSNNLRAVRYPSMNLAPFFSFNNAFVHSYADLCKFPSGSTEEGIAQRQRINELVRQEFYWATCVILGKLAKADAMAQIAGSSFQVVDNIDSSAATQEAVALLDNAIQKATEVSAAYQEVNQSDPAYQRVRVAADLHWDQGGIGMLSEVDHAIHRAQEDKKSYDEGIHSWKILRGNISLQLFKALLQLINSNSLKNTFSENEDYNKN